MEWSLIEPEEVGGIKDSDQYFLQVLGGKAGGGRNVADFLVIESFTGRELFVVSLCLYGEQDVCYMEGKDGNLLPYNDEEGTVVRLIDEPEKWLELRRLELESGEEYLYYGDSCWLEPRYFVRDRNGKFVEIGDEVEALKGGNFDFEVQEAILTLQANEECVFGSISDYALDCEEAVEIGRLAACLRETMEAEA